MFSMRIVSADHYMAEPIPELDMVYSEFRSSKIVKVPVIRLFGPTRAGQKTCMHIHGVFPYLYVPYDGTQPLDQFVQQFAVSIDTAINIVLGNASSNRQHVYKISVVSGIPFYGYHAVEQPFLKIYLYNALMIKKLSELLIAGAVMNRVFQPHETHIPYTLQLFIDYNLFGMNFINVDVVKFRQPLPSDIASPADKDASTIVLTPSPQEHMWTTGTISSDMQLNSDVQRQSGCELEVDVVAADIANRLEIEENLGRNPGLCALWEDERQRRADRHLSGDLEPPSSPAREFNGTSYENELQMRLHQIVQSLQQHISQSQSVSSNNSSVLDENAANIFDSSSSKGDKGDNDTLHAVVDEDSLRLSVEAGQRVRSSQGISTSQLLNSSQDRTLVELLASLAADASQQDIVATLEDGDSILSQVLPSSDEIHEEIERESLEMSQRVWDKPVAHDDYEDVEPSGDENVRIWDDAEQTENVAAEIEEQYNLDGMDQSWNSSQWVTLHGAATELSDNDNSDSDNSDVPQLDGLVDQQKSGRHLTRSRSKVAADDTVVSPKQPANVTVDSQMSSSKPPVTLKRLGTRGKPRPQRIAESSPRTSSVPSNETQPAGDAPSTANRLKKRKVSDDTAVAADTVAVKKCSVVLKRLDMFVASGKGTLLEKSDRAESSCHDVFVASGKCTPLEKSDRVESSCQASKAIRNNSKPVNRRRLALKKSRRQDDDHTATTDSISVDVGKVKEEEGEEPLGLVCESLSSSRTDNFDNQSDSLLPAEISSCEVMTNSALDDSLQIRSEKPRMGNRNRSKELKVVLVDLASSDKAALKYSESSQVEHSDAADQPICENIAETRKQTTQTSSSSVEVKSGSVEGPANESSRYYRSLLTYGYNDCYDNGYDALFSMALYSPTESTRSELSLPSPSSPAAESSDVEFLESSPCSIDDERSHSFVHSTYCDEMVAGASSLNNDEDDADCVIIEETQVNRAMSVSDEELTAEAEPSGRETSLDGRQHSGVLNSNDRPGLSESYLCGNAERNVSVDSVDTVFGTSNMCGNDDSSAMEPVHDDTSSAASTSSQLIWRPVHGPPSRDAVLKDVIARPYLSQSKFDAFFTDPKDVPARTSTDTNNIQVRSPLVKDLPEQTFPWLSSCCMTHFQSIALSQEQSLSNSQTQFNARNLMSCPSLLVAALKTDPVVVLRPVYAPPSCNVVSEWLQQLKPDQYQNRQRLERDAEKHGSSGSSSNSIQSNETSVTNSDVQKSVTGRDAKGSPSSYVLKTPAPKARTATKRSSRLSSTNRSGKMIKDTSDDSITRSAVTRSSGQSGSSLQAIAEEDEEVSVDKPGSAKSPHPVLSGDSSSSLPSQTGAVAVLCGENSTARKTPAVPSGSSSEGLRLSGVVGDQGSSSDSALRGSFLHQSLCIGGVKKASRVELEVPALWTPRKTSAGAKLDGRKECDRSTAVDDVCDPIASTPYSNSRTDSVIEDKLLESPIDCVPDTPRRPSGGARQKGVSKSRIQNRASAEVTVVQAAGRPIASTKETSQLQGPTPKNPFGFKLASQNLDEVKGIHEYQFVTVLSVELLTTTRADLRPDPEFDGIQAVFYAIHTDAPRSKFSSDALFGEGVIMVSADKNILHKSGMQGVNVTFVDTELQLVDEVISLVKRCDADILVGYELERCSWGYLIQRCAHLGRYIPSQLSRITAELLKDHPAAERADKDSIDEMTDIRIVGRVVLNLWRIVRHEVSLNIYTFENVAFHVLHVRYPLYSYRTLSGWFNHKTHLYRWRTVEYFGIRARGNLQLIDKLDLIGQTGEFARIFGIEFYQVFSRGSQYRVESMMLRLAKPLNYVAVSPSVQQRARMAPPECIPLNLEPLSQFYTHPVVVLDFQSLYPSIMIAYNYCFSTCLGRMPYLARAHEGAFDFGCTSLNVPPKLLKTLEDSVNICPNGVVFVKHHIRHGILPRMVEEILNSRLMVKRAMKDYKDNPSIQKLLNSRQLGLKLIANVTFGYTSANFSGRMPCVEVGDSIVRKSRETLERAIQLVESNERWGAKVVYGDTDSMFVLLQGRTKDEAFVIGQQIADAVTMSNPKPIKLKFEKVYLPCVLQTKKRYVGFMYETPDQKEPVYDAKGIETVRRDSCQAVSKILEKSIKLLFTTSNVSMVKNYVQRQFTKLMTGSASLQDFIFAKEYRGAGGYQPGACVPALEIARRAVSQDRRAEPLVGQRVPYVIVYGTPGLPLIQLVRDPRELIADASLHLNAVYYITKQILPPLGRIFSLMGVDVSFWYSDMPRLVRSACFGEQDSAAADGGGGAAVAKKKGTLLSYFSSVNCPVCAERTQSGLCSSCKSDRQRVAVITSQRIHIAELHHCQLTDICTSCMGFVDTTMPCASVDCAVYFRMFRANQEISVVPQLRRLQLQLLDF